MSRHRMNAWMHGFETGRLQGTNDEMAREALDTLGYRSAASIRDLVRGYHEGLHRRVRAWVAAGEAANLWDHTR